MKLNGQRSSDTHRTGEVGSSPRRSSLIFGLTTGPGLGGATLVHRVVTPRLGTGDFIGLYFSKSIWVEQDDTLRVPVISGIFVLRGRFLVIEVSLYY